MKRQFYSIYRKRRVPRKLKKAAKYFVKHCIIKDYFPPRLEKTDNGGVKCSVYETHYWKIKGRRTKWKVKAAYECKREYSLSIQYMLTERLRLGAGEFSWDKKVL